MAEPRGEDIGSAETIAGSGETLADTESGGASRPAERDAPELEPGAVIGRYTVLERLGSGAMGVVYAATDPALERKVAIKLVRGDATGSSKGQQRLMREAQAMAKLQHPNVVTVFEVGMHGDHVFLAMEYIAGSTLAAWLGKRRTPREIVTAFAAAGHGLAAAHRAGIVHRDFKPANVLVAADGRVRVADFGLATAPEPGERARPIGDLAMTATGALLGTPTYMAPEQHRGEPATDKADQFAFCVALHEALYGALPFEGTTYFAYADNVLAGRIVEPPRGARVPARVRRLLLRGLAGAPADRYPDMAALLADLARNPAARRRRVLFGGGALALAGAATVVLVRGPAGDPCATAGAPIGAVWNSPLQLAMRGAFAASGARGQAAAFDHASAAIDERAGELRAARRDACVATAVHHEQSAELLDRRMACLDDIAGQLAGVIDVLTEHPSAEAIAHAPDAIRAVHSVAPCADRQRLLAGDAIPTSPGMIAAAAALRQRIDRAEALLDLGDELAARRLLAAIIPDADRSGIRSLRMRARYDDAETLENRGDPTLALQRFRELAELAAALHDDVTVAKSWAHVYKLLGYDFGKRAEADVLEPVVEAAVARADSPPEVRGVFELMRGKIETAAGHDAAAADHFAIAIRELAKAHGEKSEAVADALNLYAGELGSMGRYKDARAALDRELAIRIETVGADHAGNSQIHHRLGVLLDETGQPEQALAEFQKMYAIDLANFTPDDVKIAADLIELGVEQVTLEHPAEAIANQERAVAILSKRPDDSQAMLPTALEDLAVAYREAGRGDDSLRTYDRALAAATALRGPRSVAVADVLDPEAEAVFQAGDHTRAFALMKQSMAIKLDELGPDHPSVAFSLYVLAQYSNLVGAHADALAYSERGRAIIDKLTDKPGFQLGMLSTHGAALHGLHRDAEAIPELVRARDGYRAEKRFGEAAAVAMDLADAEWTHGAHADAIAEANAVLPQLTADRAPIVRAWLAKHRDDHR